MRRSGSRAGDSSPTSTCTPSTRCSTARPGSSEVVAAAAADGQPAHRHHRPRQHVRGPATSTRRARTQGIKPIIGSEALHGPRARRERPSRRGRHGRLRRRRRGRQEALLPPDRCWPRTTSATRTSSSSRAGPSWRATTTSPGSTGSCSTQHSEGRHRHHRLPRRPRAAAPAAGRRRRSALEGGRPAPGHLRARQPLRRDPGPRHPRAAPHQPAAVRASPSASRRRCSPPTTATTPTATTPWPTTPCCACRPASLMSDPDRFKFHGDEHYLKTAAGDAPPVRRGARGVRQLAVDRRALPTSRSSSASRSCPTSRCPRASTTTPTTCAPHLRGRRASAGARSCPTRSSSAWPTSSRSSATWGSPRTSSSCGTSSSTPATPTSGSARAVARAAGCAVAYCLRITDLDPIKYDLLFERFLNPSRISMPDIDMDFDSRYRDEMIRYAAERYGRDHVAQIVTFSTIKARAAVRDAARVLGLPVRRGRQGRQGHAAADHGPRHAALRLPREPHPKFEDGYKMAADLRTMYDEDPDVKQVIDVAKGLEGLRRQDGIHAAAVVITKDPLTDYLPDPAQARGRPGPRGRAGRHPVRDGRRRGARPAQDGLPGPAQPRRHLRHARAHQGRPAASTSTSTTCRSTTTRPRAALPRRLHRRVPARGRRHARAHALAGAELASRTSPPSWPSTGPGPMAANMHNDYADRKNGRKPVEYFHPDAEELLGDTYGLMIYQESVMRVAQKFAGYSLAEADNLRKACGKKIRELMAKEQDDVRRGLRGHRLRRDARHRAVRHHRAVRRLRLQQEPQLTATASSPTRPPTSRRTTRSSTWPRCSPA